MPNLGSRRWSMGSGSPPTVCPRVNSDRMIMLRKGWKRRGGDAESNARQRLLQESCRRPSCIACHCAEAWTNLQLEHINVSFSTKMVPDKRQRLQQRPVRVLVSFAQTMLPDYFPEPDFQKPLRASKVAAPAEKLRSAKVAAPQLRSRCRRMRNLEAPRDDGRSWLHRARFAVLLLVRALVGGSASECSAFRL